jgi:hypothetical protein
MLVCRGEHVEFVDVDSGLESWRLVDVGSVDDVSEVYVASILRVEVRRVSLHMDLGLTDPLGER